MQLAEVGALFSSVLPEATYHYFADDEHPEKYIVWSEDGQAGATHADNKMDIQVKEGTVDLFTKNEYDPAFDEIQKAMNKADMSWRWESTQYEEDTEYIHHEWVWEVTSAIG